MGCPVYTMLLQDNQIYFADTNLKDIKVEEKLMGYHGLPVELGVEKELNITKEDIEKVFQYKSIMLYGKKCHKIQSFLGK